MRSKWLLGLVSLCLGLFAAIPADAEGSTQKGHEGAISVQSAEFQILAPTDLGSGLASGKRQHKPLTILKEVDKASPLLLQALVTNENLTLFNLQLVAPGQDSVVYRIDLSNARVVDVHMITVDGRSREQVSFAYQKITWTWVSPNVVAMDDWNATGQ